MINIIKNKKGVQLNLALYALVVVSVAVLAIGAMITQWNTDYSSGLTYDLTDFDKLDEAAGTAETQRGNISSQSSTQDDSNFEGTTLRAVFGIVNTIFTPFNVVLGNDGMLASLTDRWGMPDYIRQGMVTMMIFALTFAIITIFFGRRKT